MTRRLVLVTIVALAGCAQPRDPAVGESPAASAAATAKGSTHESNAPAPSGRKAPAPSTEALGPTPTTTPVAETPSPPLVAAARARVGVTLIYDPAYVGLKYPNGDVPNERGVCTDVVIRALRAAHTYDLQQKVHEDMKRAFSKYPTIWGARRPDRNIDHRRVPNLRRYFERQGWSIDPTNRKTDYRPGDIVTCTVGGGRPHIMIVSDRKNDDGIPLVIHNIGMGTQEEDMLFSFPLTGHYRPQFGSSSSATAASNP